MRLGSKGNNQVDLAVAASILIIIFAFTASHISNYYSTPLQVTKSSELRARSMELEKLIFENRGTPPNWHWKDNTTRPGLGTTIWRVPVYLEETNGTSGTWEISASINPGFTHGLPNAWEGSIIAYRNGSALPTDVQAGGSGFLSSFEVTFQTHMDANEEDTVFIYYSQDNMTNADRASLTGSRSHTLDVTVLPERDLEGVTGYRLESLGNLSFQEAKEKLGTKRNFNISLTRGNYEFSYGVPVPERASTYSYSQNTVFQNKTGHIKIAESRVTVW